MSEKHKWIPVLQVSERGGTIMVKRKEFESTQQVQDKKRMIDMITDMLHNVDYRYVRTIYRQLSKWSESKK